MNPLFPYGNSTFHLNFRKDMDIRISVFVYTSCLLCIYVFADVDICVGRFVYAYCRTCLYVFPTFLCVLGVESLFCSDDSYDR